MKFEYSVASVEVSKVQEELIIASRRKSIGSRVDREYNLP